MLAASQQFATMIDGQDIICDVYASITLPGGLYPGGVYPGQTTYPGGADPDVTLAVESLSITAQITTDMPQGTRLDVGYPKIDATIVLSGLIDRTNETKTAAWLFSPWGATASDGSVSQLYRTKVLNSPVFVDIGLDPEGSHGKPELLRKFTGYIDEVTVNSDGSVTLNCLDNHTKLRAVPTTPAVVTAPPANNGLTSEFVIDSLVYRASDGKIGTRPATRPNCILNVGLRTSTFPDVGFQYGTNLEPVFAASAFGSGLYVEQQVGNLGFTTTEPAGSTFFFEYWITGASPSTSYGQRVIVSDSTQTNYMLVMVNQTTFNVYAPGNNGTTPDFTWPFGSIDSGVHYVAVKWAQSPGSRSWSATLYLDNLTPQAASGTSTAARSTAGWSNVLINTLSNDNMGTVSALQVTNETNPATNYPFTPTAVLDPSLNKLQAVPAYSGDPWSIIQQIADAELGVAGFDEAGVFRFHNRDTLRSGAVVRTLTSATSLLSLSSTLSASELINRVQVTTQPWTFTSKGLAYSASTAQRIAARSTQTFTIDLGTTLVGQIYNPQPSTLPNGHNPNDGLSWFRAATSKAGTTEAVLKQGAVTLQQTDSSHVQVTVTNPYSVDIWLVSPARYTDIAVGTPALWIGGTSATQAAGNVADQQWPPVNPDGTGGAASSQTGEVAYSISANQWVQDDTTANQLAVDILTDMCMPRPSLTGVEIVPDPRLQLADRVVIQDPDVSNINEHALLFGWSMQWSAAQGLSMSIDARTIAFPGGWILGVTGRSELKQTTLI